MSKQRTYIIASILSLATVVLIISSSFRETNDNPMQAYYQILPVPIPEQLSFAGEDVPMDHFDVKERIDRELIVNTYWQSNSLLILKRSKKTFATVEPILKEYNIPNDLKYLAVAESALQNVKSPAGALGIWQFMKSSAQEYGLRVNEEIDERLHLEKSTRAACEYLKSSYEDFGSWTLAAASYNRGKNGLRRALNQQGVTTYYDLHLNNETARYIPRIIAFKYILSKPDVYGFMVKPSDFYAEIQYKTIEVTEVKDLYEFAKKHGSNYHEIKTLNPWILKNSLSKTYGPYKIKAPLK